MADLNYVSPLTSDLTDYYTKTEVDELQQGDENRFATQAQITAGDNEVKGWVASQGYLTQHQSLANYATKEYVDEAIEDIEVSGGMKVRVVNTLPAVGEEGIFYLVYESNDEEENRYAEYIWSDTLNAYEMLGYDTGEGVMPDLTNYATKSYVDTAVGSIVVPDVSDFIDAEQAQSIAADEVEYKMGTLSTVAVSGSYNDLSDKPVIPTAPDLSSYATKVELSAKANSADLAAVATTGSYNDLTNKPAIPSISGLATETYVDNAVAGISVPANTSDLTNDSGFITSADLPDTSGFVESSDLATVATTGDYDDLTNKPTIPVLPTLATVATSGSYNDLSDKPTIPQNTGITSAAGALPLAFIGFNDSQIYCNISRLSNNQDKVKAFNSGYLCRIAANDNIVLLPEEAILPGSDNTSRFRGYTVNSNGTYTSGNGSLSNGYYYIYGACIVQRISPNAYIICYDNNQSIAQFYKNILLTYSNTTSGLTATTIQGAIDELAAASGGGSSVGYTYDSTTKTVSLSGVSDDNL